MRRNNPFAGEDPAMPKKRQCIVDLTDIRRQELFNEMSAMAPKFTARSKKYLSDRLSRCVVDADFENFKREIYLRERIEKLYNQARNSVSPHMLSATEKEPMRWKMFNLHHQEIIFGYAKTVGKKPSEDQPDLSVYFDCLFLLTAIADGKNNLLVSYQLQAFLIAHGDLILQHLPTVTDAKTQKKYMQILFESYRLALGMSYSTPTPHHSNHAMLFRPLPQLPPAPSTNENTAAIRQLINRFGYQA